MSEEEKVVQTCETALKQDDDPSLAAQALMSQKKRIEEQEAKIAKLEKAEKDFYNQILNGTPAPEVVQAKTKSQVQKEFKDLKKRI